MPEKYQLTFRLLDQYEKPISVLSYGEFTVADGRKTATFDSWNGTPIGFTLEREEKVTTGAIYYVYYGPQYISEGNLQVFTVTLRIDYTQAEPASAQVSLGSIGEGLAIWQSLNWWDALKEHPKLQAADAETSAYPKEITLTLDNVTYPDEPAAEAKFEIQDILFEGGIEMFWAILKSWKGQEIPNGGYRLRRINLGKLGFDYFYSAVPIIIPGEQVPLYSASLAIPINGTFSPERSEVVFATFPGVRHTVYRTAEWL